MKRHIDGNENILVVSKPLARAIGLEQSIVLRRLDFWLDYNKKDTKAKQKSHFRDGLWWSWNTYQDWEADLGFCSSRSIQRYFQDLEDLGLVISTDQYNKMSQDRTKWYTIDYELYDDFFMLWEHHGSPIKNGGHTNSEYKQFLAAWDQYKSLLMLIDLFRANPSSCQLGISSMTIWQVNSHAKLVRAIPVGSLEQSKTIDDAFASPLDFSELSDEMPETIKNGYSELEVWIIQTVKKAHYKTNSLTEPMRKLLEARSPYWDPKTKKMVSAKDAPTITELYETDLGYKYYLKNEIGSQVERFKLSRSETIRRMSDLNKFYNWREKNRHRFENNEAPLGGR